MADEPTIGEVMRTLAGLQRSMEQKTSELQRSVDQVSGKVLTVDVWRVEKESWDRRLAEAEKDISIVDSKVERDREKHAADKRAADERSATMRRQIIGALLTAFVAPILVAIVLAYLLRG